MIVKGESGSCSGRVGGSASRCMMRSQEEYCTNSRHPAVGFRGVTKCGGIGMNYQPDKHTRTRTIVCAHSTIPLGTRSVCSQLLPCCWSVSRHPVSTLQFSFATAFSVLIRLWCSDDKISWLRWVGCSVASTTGA